MTTNALPWQSQFLWGFYEIFIHWSVSCCNISWVLILSRWNICFSEKSDVQLFVLQLLDGCFVAELVTLKGDLLLILTSLLRAAGFLQKFACILCHSSSFKPWQPPHSQLKRNTCTTGSSRHCVLLLKWWLKSWLFSRHASLDGVQNFDFSSDHSIFFHFARDYLRCFLNKA